MYDSRIDVIIVGGGPGGSATAWALARAGARVLVLDRARFPRDKPCAEYLSPEASRILSDMGALDACERRAAQLAGMRVRSPSGDVIHGDFAAGHGFSGFRDRGLALRRRDLDALLLDRARDAGVVVREGVRVTDVLRDSVGRACGVAVLDENGRATTLDAPFVVGADGLRSVISRRLGLARSARWPRRLALVTHYEGVANVGPYGEMHVERGGYLGIADVGGGVTNVAVVAPVSRMRGASGDAAGWLDAWIAARPHLAPRFTGARRVSRVWATGPFASRSRRAWAPGAALVGDAADFFDPFTGEGIYAALRGGELLAPRLLEALGAQREMDERAALSAYARDRRRAFGGKWIVERIIGTAVAFPTLMNHAAAVLSRRKALADLLVGVAGDFVPPREVLHPRFLLSLLLPPRPTT